MIGVDAADPDFIGSHAAALPTLGGLLGDDRTTMLTSPGGAIPGAVWPTFFTGQPPGVHGNYHHLQWDADAMRLRRVDESWFDAEPFWADPRFAGRRICVLDVPRGYRRFYPPALELRDWGTHDKYGPFACSDPAIEKAVRRRFGESPMGIEVPVDKRPRQLRRIRDDLVESVGRRGALIRWLRDLDDWELFIAVFGESHRGGHILWPDGLGAESPIPSDALLDVYRAIDVEIAAIVESLEPTDSLILFSAHGMAARPTYEHLMAPLVGAVNRAAHGGAANAERRPPRQRSPIGFLRRTVPAGIQHAIAQNVPQAVRDWVVNQQVAAGHDWTRTPAVALFADLSGYIRFNLADRERDGSLTPGSAAHERYENRLRETLRTLRDVEHDTPLVDAIQTPKDNYAGPRAHLLPDLIVTWREDAPGGPVAAEGLDIVSTRPPSGRTANHHGRAFVAIRGPLAHAGNLPPLRDTADLAGLATVATVATVTP